MSSSQDYHNAAKTPFRLKIIINKQTNKNVSFLLVWHFICKDGWSLFGKVAAVQLCEQLKLHVKSFLFANNNKKKI